MGKTKLLQHGKAGQQCKKHTPIGFSEKYAIKFALVGLNKNNMEKWVVSAVCQKLCLLFPINLILLGWMLLLLKSIWATL